MVTWDRITAECDGYRAGFVAVYRKYQGEPTDEVDGSNRVIKVTAQSFADHSGIAASTFKRWLKAGEEVTTATVATSGPARTGQIARQAVKSDKVSIEDKVGMLDDLMSDKKVIRSWREQRYQPEDPAHARHVEAVVDAFVEPLATRMGRLRVPMWIGQLEQIAEGIAEQELEGDDVRGLDKAVGAVTNEIEVQKFRTGLEVE